MVFLRLLRGYATKADINKIRNIGVIAHIDAGKTTTTERMLYYSGKINRIGNVDQGDTITDYLPQERSRGITIQSAAISFKWQKEYDINLIDTPGHADFTFEVIRSLKVLDGCVTILDAVAGVESQTEKVWKQAVGIPKVCFINKMDRIGAGYSRTVKELIVKMNVRPLLINTPMFHVDSVTREPVFYGVLDVVNMSKLIWDIEDPDKIEVKPVEENDEHYEEVHKCRESLVETLSEIDEELLNYFLETAEGDYMKIPANVLDNSVRKATLSHYATPILCGASFRNIGVQPLLDAIVKYLPSPLEATKPKFNNENLPAVFDPKVGLFVNKNPNLCVALAFKVITDSIRGIMIFVRVYSGVLVSGHTAFNTSTGVKFKLGSLVKMHANVTEAVKALYPGELGVLVGSTVSEHVRTGDTIVSHSRVKDGVRSLNKKNELTLCIHPIEIPPPVFSAAIEPHTRGNKKAMDDALSQLSREDPSLLITRDEESGQTLLNGMGELHLEIATDRLLNEFHAPVNVGKVFVSYKETLNTVSSVKTISNDAGYKVSIQLGVLDKTELENPNRGEKWYPLGSDNNYMVLERHRKYNQYNWPYQVTYQSIVNAFIPSCIVALQRGGKIANYPLHSTVVRIKDWDMPTDATSVGSLLQLSRSLMLSTLEEIPDENYLMLEPIMQIEVTVHEKDVGIVVQDLTAARNANILSIEDEYVWSTDITSKDSLDYQFRSFAEKQYLPADHTLQLAKVNTGTHTKKIIIAEVPLRDMMSYMNKLRMLTKGSGTLHMQYLGMNPLTRARQSEVLKDAF
ncbi:HBR447Cp [Eremothecium sinecaudum]|uniref:Ribosome-releasing factor 2, mitochondrial n=1 Tax=Eremothecium sinecaudum TaxID=45286 RepID=A0A109UXI0_9SACH|nr:HBR447Cp [Eremothecium sinecaudum]AMD19348.1 HBR447Cp [Eremothecium sinecaudum]